MNSTTTLRRSRLVPGRWVKSTKSDNSGPYCVSVMPDGGTGVLVADSKENYLTRLGFSEDAWSSFLAQLRAGQLAGAENGVA